MATSNQEKTYNEFVKFYDLADNLIDKAENCNDSNAKEQFDEIEKMVIFLEEATDILTNDYIEIVKDSKNQEKAEEIQSILLQIQIRTKQCKAKLQELENKNNS